MIAWLLVVVLAAPAASLPSVHFNRAQRLFAQGRYRDALDEFTAASEAAPREVPDLWFDIGQCHRNLGNARQAVAAFRRYLILRPDAADRARVIALIEKLGGSADELTDGAPASAMTASISPVAPEPAGPAAVPSVAAGEDPSPPTSTLSPASDSSAAGPRTAPAATSTAGSVSASRSVDLVPWLIPRRADPPRATPRRTWPIWVGVAAGVVAVAAIGVGVGVGVNGSHPSVTMPMTMPMSPPGGSPGLGTSVTIDTRGK